MLICFHSSWLPLGVEFLSLMIILYWKFCRIIELFSKMMTPFTFPLAMDFSFSFSKFSPTMKPLYIVWFKLCNIFKKAKLWKWSEEKWFPAIEIGWEKWISSVQFIHSVMSDSLRPHELKHARPPCPSPTPGVHWDSRLSSQWCHPAIKEITNKALLYSTGNDIQYLKITYNGKESEKE